MLFYHRIGYRNIWAYSGWSEWLCAMIKRGLKVICLSTTSQLISCIPTVYIQMQHGNKSFSTSHIIATSLSQESRSGMHSHVPIHSTHSLIILTDHSNHNISLRSNWKNIIFPLLGKRLSRDPYEFEYERFHQQSTEVIVDSFPIKKIPSSNTVGYIKN